jgi:hypothetical protein
MKQKIKGILILGICCSFLNGCIAAVVPIIAVGVAGAAAGVVTLVNLARDQYPDIDFDKPSPVEMVYANSYNETWNGVVDTLMEMKESTAMMDKNSGVVRTNRKNLNDVSWIGKGLGKATFLYELNLTVREKNGRVSVEAMVPFWEEKMFIAQKEKNVPEGSNMMRHIFYRNLNKRVQPVAQRLADSPLQDIRYAPMTKETQTKDTVREVATLKKNEQQQPGPRVTMIKIKQSRSPINVRSVPSTENNKPIAALKGGTGVEKIDENGSWYKIRFIDSRGSQKEGWISKSLVEQ